MGSNSLSNVDKDIPISNLCGLRCYNDKFRNFFLSFYAKINIVPYSGGKIQITVPENTAERKILDSQKGRINRNVTPGSSKK
jgi:hypothetical protein